MSEAPPLDEGFDFEDDYSSDADSEGLCHSLSELSAMDLPEEVALLHPILPQIGIAALVGVPDSGKSMFARELALRIAAGSSEFIGYELRPRHNRAIFVSTEDDKRTTRNVMMRQVTHLMESNTVSLSKQETMNNLRVLIGSGINSHEMIKLLDGECKKQPVDIIIIDSFGDTFAEYDGNSNSQIRTALKPFGSFAQDYECLILFLAHVNKSSYFDSPTQAHVQGASSFAAKTRVVIDLRAANDDPAQRYLTITKGNYVPNEFKTHGRQILFNKDTFLNEYTGVEIPRAEVGKRAEPAQASNKAKAINWQLIFGNDQELGTGELSVRIAKEYNLADRQSRNYIYEQLEAVRKGIYRRPPSADDVTPLGL